MPSYTDLERKVDDLSDKIAEVATSVTNLDTRISSHDVDDQRRHGELRQDIHAMQANLFRLLFAGLGVILIAMGLMGALVGVKMYLDTTHVSIGGRVDVVATPSPSAP